MLGEIICVIHESWLAFFLSLLPFLLLFLGGGEGGYMDLGFLPLFLCLSLLYTLLWGLEYGYGG